MFRHAKVPWQIWVLTLIGFCVGLSAAHDLTLAPRELSLYVAVADLVLGISAGGLLFRVTWLYWIFVLSVSIKIVSGIALVTMWAFFATQGDEEIVPILALFGVLTLIWLFVFLGLRSKTSRQWMEMGSNKRLHSDGAPAARRA